MSGKRDSNPRPSAWKADALSTELLPQVFKKTVQSYNYFQYSPIIICEYLNLFCPGFLFMFLQLTAYGIYCKISGFFK
jgi:hypothetical protein